MKRTTLHYYAPILLSGGRKLPTQSKVGNKVKFAGQGGRDVELERLRKIEANYEKDKAMLAKEKVPALARSESHDIGHVEGGKVDSRNKKKAAKKLHNEFITELKRKM